MSTQPEADVAAQTLLLEKQLEEMARGSKDAEAFLAFLGSALFPSGAPGIDQVTWPEPRAGAQGSAPEPESAEDRLRAAEARYRTLVEQIPAVTFAAVLGEGKNEIYVSPHIEAMLGFTQKEWLDAPFLWYWQLHPDDREVWNKEFTRGLQTGGPFRAECRFFARDGHVVWVHGEARVVKDAVGRPLLLQGVAFDITESKRAQEVVIQETRRHARIEEEMAIARRVQTSILPRNVTIEGLEVSAAMFPAEDVGGDYYDVLPFPGGAWLAIGDVSGHGLNSGLVMLMVQSAMGAIVRAQPDATPRQVLVTLNQLLFDNIRARLTHDDHVTLSLLRYRSDGQVTFAGAHEDLVVCRHATGKLEFIRTPGTWLGAARDISSVTVDSTLQLFEGDVLLLYTDGIIEATNAQAEPYEIERLSQALVEVHRQPVEQIRDHLLQQAAAWRTEQDDDITLLVLRYSKDVGGVAVAGAAVAAAPAARATWVFPSTSRFEGSLDSRVEPVVVQAASDGHLRADGVASGSLLGLRLSGAAETPDQAGLEAILEAVHREALERGCTEVEVDLRQLKFMTSSCLKSFITWFMAVRAEPVARRYGVRLVSNPQLRWQRASLAALASFAPELMAKGSG